MLFSVLLTNTVCIFSAIANYKIASNFFLSLFGVSFISGNNCNCTATLSWKGLNAFIQYPCNPSGLASFQFFNLHSYSFKLSVFVVIFSCFFAPLSCVSTRVNHSALFLCLTSQSHIFLQNLILSWVPGLMPLLLLSFSSLSCNIAWFVLNVLFWTYCWSCLISC